MSPSSNNEITLFAETNFRNQCRLFGIKKDDRRRHMYFVGKTGMGKSTALENLIISDIRAGRGIAVVDPHGDLVEKIIEYIPSSRINDVVYLNPADVEYPIAFNVLEAVDSQHQHLVASGLIGVFKKIWADSWGPRLEYVLRNAILALLDYPGSTLLGVMRILVDKAYRKKVIDKIKDPVVKSFWVEEYSKYPDKFQTEAIAPIQNKVGQFLSNALIRNIVGQVKSAINMREIMDNEKIILMNLAKGRIGEDTSALLGAMMITKLQMAAMERIDIPEPQRRDFYLYVDEFQNFATQSFANILSEARKYRLNLIIAHQYIEQLEPDFVRPAVFGNVGTIVLFRVGGADAEFLETEFMPRFTPEDLVNLPKYNTYMKLMIDGVSSDPFSARILPPLKPEEKTGNKDKIIRVSRERYAQPKKVIEEKIARWSGVMGGEEQGAPQKTEKKQEKAPEPKSKVEAPVVVAPPVTPVVLAPFPAAKESGEVEAVKKKKKKKKKNAGQQTGGAALIQHEVNCHRCGVKTILSFIPDGRRPVYCKECLKLVKRSPSLGPERETPYRPDRHIGTGTGVKNSPQKNTQVPIPNRTEKPSRPQEPASLSLKEAVQREPVPFAPRGKMENQKQKQKQPNVVQPEKQVPSSPSNGPQKLQQGDVIQFV